MNSDQIEVPAPDATIQEIFEFALSYNAYDRHDGFTPVAEVGNRLSRDWHAGRDLPDDIHTLRTALFFEQRRWCHFDRHPDTKTEQYLHALIDAIRAGSGGTVAGPRDQLP